MSGWQPISTAPLDDWLVVGWLADDGGWGGTATAVWSEDHETFVDSFSVPLPWPDGWRPLGGGS